MLIFVLTTVINMAIILTNVIAFGSVTAFVITVILTVVSIGIGAIPVVIVAILILNKSNYLDVVSKQKQSGRPAIVAFHLLAVGIGVFFGVMMFAANIVAGGRGLVEIIDIRFIMIGIISITAVAVVVYGVLAMIVGRRSNRVTLESLQRLKEVATTGRVCTSNTKNYQGGDDGYSTQKGFA